MKGLDETPQSTLADCYKYTSDGWVKFSTMTKSRAFAASAWVNISACKKNYVKILFLRVFSNA